MMKKTFLILTALFVAACTSKPQSPYSLLAPKQIQYQHQTFELAKTERQNLLYGRFTYVGKDMQQLHYILSSMVMPLDKVQESLAVVAKQKGYIAQFKTANDKLYVLTQQKEAKAISYKQSVSKNSDCGTLTVIKNSAKKTVLFDTELGNTLEQMKCQKNH